MPRDKRPFHMKSCGKRAVTAKNNRIEFEMIWNPRNREATRTNTNRCGEFEGSESPALAGDALIYYCQSGLADFMARCQTMLATSPSVAAV